MMLFSKLRKLVLIAPLLLAMVPMTGCLTASTAIKIEQQTAAEACRAWPNTIYHSKKDQPDTVASARVNNRAKTAYCAGTGETK